VNFFTALRRIDSARSDFDARAHSKSRSFSLSLFLARPSSMTTSPPSSPEDARLAALSRELDAAVARINALQSGGRSKAGTVPSIQAVNQASTSSTSSTSTSTSSSAKQQTPFRARASSHFARHGSRLTSALLAGCAFAVAAGRLSDARERREAAAAWEAERRELEGRAEAAESALKEAMARLNEGGGGGGEGGGSGDGGSGGSSWSSWWLPSSKRERRKDESLSSSSQPPPPPPPKPRMI
jgi:hypothetical protein